MQKVHWKDLGGDGRGVDMACLPSVLRDETFLLLRLRPASMELKEPNDPREAREYAEAKEPPLEKELSKLLADERAHSDLPDPSSVKL